MEVIDLDTADDLFHTLKLRRESVREQIADRIQEMVAANQLQAGTQLPSERELARMLGVNRATVREAIRLLEQRGLVRMKLGSGTYIAHVPSSTVAETIARYFTFGSCSHEDLVKLREMLDPEIAALAAERAQPEDLVELSRCIGEIDSTFRSGVPVPYAHADAAFHEAIARATHNPLVIAITSGLHQIVRAWILAQSSVHRLEGGALSHRAVYDAITTRNPAAARSAMQVHHTFTRAAMLTTGDLAVLHTEDPPIELLNTDLLTH
jgi:GntR family transcriptional repressor for pyruvate dehydrogenase complex